MRLRLPPGMLLGEWDAVPIMAVVRRPSLSMCCGCPFLLMLQGYRAWEGLYVHLGAKCKAGEGHSDPAASRIMEEQSWFPSWGVQPRVGVC